MAVYTTALTVTGLNQDRYLVQNPIYVDIAEISTGTKYIRVTLTPVAFSVSEGTPEPEPISIRLRPFGNQVYFDAARYIRAMMPSPQHPYPLVNGMTVPKNTLRVRIKITAVDEDLNVTDTRTFTRSFVRGGRWNRKTNISLGAPTVLKVSDLIPQWPGYPIAKYTLNASGQIIFNSIVTAAEIEQRRVIGCNPVYVRYMNREGGYSFWLFETYSLQKKTDKTDIIERRGVLRTTGNEPTYKLSVRGRVERKYFGAMRSLAEAPEVAVFKLENILGDNLATLSEISGQFTDVINNGQDVDTPGEADYLDLEFEFEIVLTHSPLVKW